MRKLIFILIWLIPVVSYTGWFYSGPFGKIYQIIPVSYSEFLGCGYIDRNENRYFYLFKIDIQGNILWSNYYGSIFYQQVCRDFEIISDSGILMTGTIKPDIASSSEIYLVKTDQTGELIWSKIIGEENISEEANSIIQTYDGNFVIAGYKNSTTSNWDDSYLLKINSVGDTIWTKTWGVDSLNDYLVDLLETDDRGLIILGYSSNGFYSKIHLTKTDSLGDTIWTQILIEGGKNHASTIREIPGKGYVVLGYTSKFSGADDILVICTDYQGNTKWSQIYDNGIKDKAYSLDLTPDGGFVVAGSTQEVTVDIYIMKIDSFGRKLWDRIYGSSNHIDEGLSIKTLNNNGFLISGYYDYYVWYWPTEKIFVLKTDSLGVAVEENIFSSPQQNFFAVTTGGNLRTRISFSLTQAGQVSVDVYDLSGRNVSSPVEGYYPAGEHNIYWQAPLPGIYFFRIRSDQLDKTVKTAVLR